MGQGNLWWFQITL